MAKNSFMLSDIDKIASSEEPVVITEIKPRYAYSDGKRTDLLENIVISAVSNKLGDFQLLFPPNQSFYEKLQAELEIPSIIRLDEKGFTVEDVKVSHVNGRSYINFMMKG